MSAKIVLSITRIDGMGQFADDQRLQLLVQRSIMQQILMTMYDPQHWDGVLRIDGVWLEPEIYDGMEVLRLGTQGKISRRLNCYVLGCAGCGLDPRLFCILLLLGKDCIVIMMSRGFKRGFEISVSSNNEIDVLSYNFCEFLIFQPGSLAIPDTRTTEIYCPLPSAEHKPRLVGQEDRRESVSLNLAK
jgi:hypothetical protein